MSADPSSLYALDPFGPSANPGAYVACEASERARAALEHALDVGRIAAVVGPPGHGKTLLLRLLGGREEDRARVAYVPYCKLEVDELFTVVLNTLGAARPGPPRETLLAVIRELAPRGGVVILVDDANALSDPCASALASLYAEAKGALRIALAAVHGPDSQRLLRAFGAAVDIVPLTEGMSGREARRYVEMRLAYGGARPELVAAFDEQTVDALHRASQGVPRRLNQAAQDVVWRAMRATVPRLREISGGASAQVLPMKPVRPPRPRTSTAPPAAPAPPSAPIVPPPKPRVVVAPPPAPAPPSAPTVPPPKPRVVVAPPPAPAPPSAPTVPPPKPRVVVAPPPAPAPPSAPTVPPPKTRVVAVPPPAAVAPPPAAPRESDLDDGRGILLPGVFNRPGVADRSGEYRLVRGRPVAPEETPVEVGAGEPSGPPGLVETVLVAPPPMRRHAPPPPPVRRARPTPPSAATGPLPIRLIGIAGFVLGFAASLYLMMTRPAPKPQPAPAEPPAIAIAQPQAVPTPPAATADVPAPEPAPPETSAAVVAPVPSPQSPSHTAATATPEPPPAAILPEPVRVGVSINATPWAIVRVDGREIGETPLANVELEVGPHVFEARMPDGSTRERRIEIGPDRDVVVFE